MAVLISREIAAEFEPDARCQKLRQPGTALIAKKSRAGGLPPAAFYSTPRTPVKPKKDDQMRGMARHSNR
jgi:hypothetical protein